MTPSIHTTNTYLESLEAVGKAEKAEAGRIDYGGKRRPPIDITELTKGMSQEDIIKRGAVDLDFFAAFMLPSTCTMPFPPLLHAVWDEWVAGAMILETDRVEVKQSTAIPRGYSKTTLEKLFDCWCVFYTSLEFFVVIGSTGPAAQNIVQDVIDMLGAPHVRTVYGNWDTDVKNDSKELKRFKYKGKDMIFLPKGVLTAMRGVNINNRRIDVLQFDDAQTEENAKSETESNSLRGWILNTMIPALSDSGGLVLYVGNVYPHKGSFLNVLQALPSWKSLTLGAILEDGTTLWEELHSTKKLLDGYRDAVASGEEAAWLAQFMNATDFSRQSKLRLDLLAKHSSKVYAEYHTLGLPECSFVVLDLSSGKIHSDNAVILGVQVYNGICVAVSATIGVFDPKAYIYEVFRMARRINATVVFNEDVGYQSTNAFWLNEMQQQLDYKVEVINFSPPRTSKEARIVLSYGELNRGQVVLLPDVLKRYKAEAKEFNPKVSNNDDNLMDTVQHIPTLYLKHKNRLENAQGFANYSTLYDQSIRTVGQTYEDDIL